MIKTLNQTFICQNQKTKKQIQNQKKKQNAKHKQPMQYISYQQEKPSPSSTSYSQQNNTRLMKTQLPPKSKQSLNSTQYKLPPPVNNTIKRIQSTKSSSSSTHNNQIPQQKINYDIESNMTQSKIITAKESLQLLKKKMNRTGMSRQKPSTQTKSNQNIPVQQNKTNYSNNADSMKKIKADSSKNIQSYQPPSMATKYSSQSAKNYQQQQQQSYSSKDTYEPQSYKAPVKKPVQQQRQEQVQKPQMKKTTSISQNYYNEVQQVPISTKKQSFQAMLERQLRKQQQQGKGLSNNPSNNYQKNQPKVQLSEYPEDDGGELFQCSKGCGRQFNANVLAKHEKICQKVFQSKRKVFNTAAQRQVENQGGFQKPPEPVNKFNQTKKPAEKKTNKIPKWKLQSAQLRAGLKALNNQPLTKQQQTLTKMQSDNLVPCNYCGRRFNQTAAQRHIPVCANKAKQVNRAPVGKKK